MRITEKIFNQVWTMLLGAAVAAVLFASVPATAQANLPPNWVFARNYAGWNIVGQTANTYTFNGGACNYTPYNLSGISPSFFVFSGTNGASTVYFPVAIIDANSSLSEVVTPTSTTQNNSSCGFAATTINQHTSFVLTSGTAGLQEAIISQQQGPPNFNVILDKYWYQSVAALPTTPSTQTAASIIASVTGNANVGIVDTTTLPWTYYQWNGSKYVALPPNGSVNFTSVTQVSAPTAVSTGASTYGLLTTATTGGSIPASSTYRMAITYVTATGGETLISTDSASTATVTTGSTATNTISVTSPASVTGAVGYRVYLSAAGGGAGTEILYTPTCTTATGQTVLTGVCAIGSSATISSIITGTAQIPAASSAFVTPVNFVSPVSQIPVSYPPFTNVATISAGSTGTLGLVNLPAGFLNVLGRTVQICGTGFGTTNSTTGTLTFATTLASLPGTTSITPFTAVSGTTTASAVVNFTFCETFTVTATGSSGTLEAHGTVYYNLAGTAVSSVAQDLITAASSAIDLTKQDQLAFTLKPTTTSITTGGAQLRQLTIQVLQ